MRTTLAPEDAERYAGAFGEDGAASLDLLVDAGYTKEVGGDGKGGRVPSFLRFDTAGWVGGWVGRDSSLLSLLNYLMATQTNAHAYT